MDMGMFSVFGRYFMAAFAIVSGAIIAVVVYGVILNKLCEWSFDRDLKKREELKKEIKEKIMRGE